MILTTAGSPPSSSGGLLRKQAVGGRKSIETAALLSTHFSPNILRVLGPARDFRADFFSADCGAMRVSTLSYNAAVELEVETSDDHLLVTTQLDGEESVRSQGRSASGRVGFVVVDSTPDPVTKRFSADSRRLNLRLDRAMMDALWQRAVSPGEPAPRVFEPFIAGEPGRKRWWSHLQLLLSYLDAPPALAARDVMMKRIEESLMLYLLLEHPHDASHALARVPTTVDDRKLRRAEEFIRAHLRDAIGLADVATAAAIGVRSLTTAFRARHGTSPMRYVDALRLDAARDALRTGRRSVTEVASEFGFSNLGRFARTYHARFGEVPSRTRSSSVDRRR